MKYFLEFIDGYEKFDNHGFLHKVRLSFSFSKVEIDPLIIHQIEWRYI